MILILGKKAEKRLQKMVEKTVARIMKHGLPEKDSQALMCDRGECDHNWSGECDCEAVTIGSNGLCVDFKEF